MQALDRQVLDWISGWPEWLAPVMVFFSTATNQIIVKVLLAALVVFLLVKGPQTRKTILLALVAVALANEITDVIKDLAPANRPYQDGLSGLNAHLVGRSNNPGTASAHSANMAAAAFAFTYFLGRWGWAWIAIALLTGLSRIYVGSHYPWQVLLGWSCGVFGAFVVVKTWEAWVRMRMPEDQDEEPEPSSG